MVDAMHITAGLGLLCIGALVLFYKGFSSQWWGGPAIPGPTPRWLWGNMSDTYPKETHKSCLQWPKQYGPVCRFFVGRQAIVIVTDPELVREVSTRQFMKAHDRPMPSIRMGHGEQLEYQMSGTLTLRGKTWAAVRAACEPLFSRSLLEQYMAVMNKAVATMLGRLGGPEGGKSMHTNDLMAGLTMTIVGETAFGVNFDAQTAETPEVVKHAKFVFAPAPPSKSGFSLPRLMLLFPFLASAVYRLAIALGSERLIKALSARGYIQGTSQVLLDKARANSKTAVPARRVPNGSVDDAETMTAGTHAPVLTQKSRTWLEWLDAKLFTDRADAWLKKAHTQGMQEYKDEVPADYSLLPRLMNTINKETQKPLTDMQILAQANTFLLAGYETTSTALAYTLFELARNPEVLAKLLKEIDAFGRCVEPGFDDLKQFPYTEAVFSEAMRMHPPVTPLFALTRELSEPMQLGKYKVPAKTRIWLNVLGMHHDEKLFPEPQVFRPERFLPDSPDGPFSRHPFAYIPFGVGPHKCIGYRFAIQEAVLTLVRLHQTFTFQLDTSKHPPGSSLEYVSGITLMPKDGIWLQPTKRDV